MKLDACRRTYKTLKILWSSMFHETVSWVENVEEKFCVCGNESGVATACNMQQVLDNYYWHWSIVAVAARAQDAFRWQGRRERERGEPWPVEYTMGQTVEHPSGWLADCTGILSYKLSLVLPDIKHWQIKSIIAVVDGRGVGRGGDVVAYESTCFCGFLLAFSHCYQKWAWNAEPQVTAVCTRLTFCNLWPLLLHPHSALFKVSICKTCLWYLVFPAVLSRFYGYYNLGFKLKTW